MQKAMVMKLICKYLKYDTYNKKIKMKIKKLKFLFFKQIKLSNKKLFY